MGQHGHDTPRRPTAPSAPPRAVSAVGNGTSVRISWQPPPLAEQNGVIRDYRVSGASRGPHPHHIPHSHRILVASHIPIASYISSPSHVPTESCIPITSRISISFHIFITRIIPFVSQALTASHVPITPHVSICPPPPPAIKMHPPTRSGAWATRADSTSTRVWRGRCWQRCCRGWCLVSPIVLRWQRPPARVWVLAVHLSPSILVSAPALCRTHGWGLQGSSLWWVLWLAPRNLLVPPLLAAPPVEREAGPVGRGGVAEQLAEMARRPAFIAGIGGACWLVLAGFGAWLYGRRRRRKELSHFTGTGTSTALGVPDPLVPSAHTGFLSLQPPSPTRPRVHLWVLQGPAVAPLHSRPSLHLSLRSPFCTPRLRRVAAPGNSTAPWELQPTQGCPLSLCPHRAAVGGHPWLVDAWCGGGTSSLDTAERYYNGEGSARGGGWQGAGGGSQF